MDQQFFSSSEADDTPAFQEFVNTVSSDTIGDGALGRVRSGIIRLTAPITFPKRFISLAGEQLRNTVFDVSDVVGSAFKFAPMDTCCPDLRDFSIIDSKLLTTTMGIDTTAVTGDMYLFNFDNLYIKVRGPAIVSYKCFSGTFRNVVGHSTTDNTFVINCGPAVTFDNLYAGTCGPTKCGYRLAGLINLQNCNGIDVGGYWGVFGQDPTLTDGFEADFPNNLVNYPTIISDNCNVEAFDTCGVKFHNTHRAAEFKNLSLIRSKSTNYRALFEFGRGSVSTAPVIIDVASIGLGTGVPVGNGSLSNAYFYSSYGNPPTILDRTGVISSVTPGVWSFNHNGIVPFVRMSSATDAYQNLALQYSNLTARRFSVQTIRYQTPAALTPIGNNQAIVVTGYSKVLLAPVAPASISSATFYVALGVLSDYGRNGELNIEAVNNNSTLIHSVGGAYTFRMKGGANATLATGEIRTFLWSSTSSQWIEV